MKTTLLELVEKKGKLPVLPDILVKLQNLLKDPDAGIVDIVRLIELEPTLAGNILKIANSAYYTSGYQKITTLLMAVNKLGLDKIKQIAFSLEIIKIFSKTDLVDMTQFWKHSLAVANLTQMMAVYTNVLLSNLGIVYLSGLMHDVGVLVFCYIIPDEYSDFLKDVDKHQTPFEKQEKNRFGLDHQELGAHFIKKWWKVDHLIAEAVQNHHSPCKGNKNEHQCRQLVYLANRLCISHGQPNGINCHNQDFDTKELEILGLSQENIGKMANDVKTAIAQSVNLLGNS